MTMPLWEKKHVKNKKCCYQYKNINIYIYIYIDDILKDVNIVNFEQ